MFFTGAHPQYHTRDDARGSTPRVARVLAIYRARGSSGRRFKTQALAVAPAFPRRRRPRTYLGTVPPSARELPGVLLQGVAPGPPQKARIRAEDRIVSFDGHGRKPLEYAARHAARPGQRCGSACCATDSGSRS
jgi:hypothetical protein